MDSVEANYVALLGLPIVKELLRKNKKLRKENKSLKNLVYSLPEFRCKCHRSSETRTVHIKKESRSQEEPTECEPLAEDEDEVVFVEAEKQNIVYVIDEQDDDEELDELDEDDLAEEQDEVEEEDEEEVEVEVEEQDEDEEEEQDEADEEEEQDEEQDEEQHEEQDEVEVEEEQEEVFEVQVSGKSYYTSDQKNGKIYAITADEEIGDEVGVFVDGKAKFHKK
jgi:hypothetical protein